MIKSLIKKVLDNSGYEIAKKQVVSYHYESMTGGLDRAKQRNLSPSVIVDIGAAQGVWTEKAMTYWPSAKYELVEPLTEQTENLKQFKIKYPNITHHLAVAGDTAGEVFLNVSPDFDGSGVYGDSVSSNARKVPVVTIDEITADTPGTILLKLDTHGYEVPILKGATEALKRTSLLIIEVYNFRISPTCLLFHELSAYLDAQGFRLADIVDIVRRPGDQIFWQADAFYARKDDPVFEKESYA